MSKGNSKDPKTYPLKLGQTFDKKSNVSYHTMRFDFKPVSLGSSKDLTMTVGGENGSEVTATMTGKQNGSSQTAPSIFKGSKAGYSAKECILIVDEVTGEVTLERLGEKIMLKKSRPEKPENKPAPVTRAPGEKMDISPSSTPDRSPFGSSAPSPLQPNNNGNGIQHSSGSTGFSRPPAREEPKASPTKPTPGFKPAFSSPPPASQKQPEPEKKPAKEYVPEIGEISDSSSSSSSDSDSSSSSSDSENEEDDNMDGLLNMDSASRKASGSPKKASPPQAPLSASQPAPPAQLSPHEQLQDHLRTTSDEGSDSDDDIFKF